MIVKKVVVAGVDIDPGSYDVAADGTITFGPSFTLVNGDTLEITYEDGEFFKHGDMVTSENGEQAIYLTKGEGAYHHVMFLNKRGSVGTIPDRLIRPLTEPLP